MAHVAKLGALTDELVFLVTSISAKDDPSRFNTHREAALRALRYHNHPRTNQFDIANQLEGLQEKFHVYNKDSLAEALERRLETLSTLDVKWSPEILQLLLELSDRPVINSKLEDLDSLTEVEAIQLPLKWRDLIDTDPLLREKAVWHNVDFSAETSDEEEYGDSRSERSDTATTESSVDGDHRRLPEICTVDSNCKQKLQALRDTQFWLKTPSVGGVKLETVKKQVTELQITRETLFMLSGLPTSLFAFSSNTLPVVVPSTGYKLKHASYDSLQMLNQSMADHGSRLVVLRLWVKRVQSIPLLQIFQCYVAKELALFDKRISRIQQGFVSPHGDTVVSLIGIHSEITRCVRCLIRLSDFVIELDSDQYAHAFRYLEMLYKETCASQMRGDEEMYAFMGAMFLDCFQVYLRLIRLWMEEGELTRGDNVFFVTGVASKLDLATIWQSQYKIRQTQSGILHAPAFLHAAADKIFIAGKSIVILKQLNMLAKLQDTEQQQEPTLDFKTMCGAQSLRLAPFPELFDVAFNSWVQSKHHRASSVLRGLLFEGCGLQNTLNAMAHLYFMAEGTTAALFTDSIFDKLDMANNAWKDPFTVNELAQSTYGFSSLISRDQLKVVMLDLPRKFQGVSKCRRSVRFLSVVQFKYQLSWPLQMVIVPETISSYQRVFTFLFQIRRSTHILRRNRLAKDALTQTSGADERALYYSLRARLLWFNQTLYHYLTVLVLEPCSRNVREDLESSLDVDAMISAHSRFIKQVTDQSLLGSRLEVIYKSIIKILDLGIRLEDAHAANIVANQKTSEEQRDMMDLSMASLGLHTPQRKSIPRPSFTNEKKNFRAEVDAGSEDDGDDVDIDLSILSSAGDVENDGQMFLEKLRKMRGDFDRLVRFVASGLKGIARAGGDNQAMSWDILGEMLDLGLGTGVTRY